MMERIHVSVRARPLSPEDAKTSPWRISGNSIFIPNLPTKFDFDRIFGEDCRTREVYEGRTKDIVAAAVSGFNGTVFAYGQTNSGKTHTMRGSAEEPGVILLSVFDLFETIQQEVDREFLLRMSYMEIYNEEINDLLAPEHRKLQIHENIERGIYVAGLREEIVASSEQVLDLMEFGESHRHIGETNMNLYSSRSHTIFRMIIESRAKAENQDTGGSCDAVRVSVLNLVDLAGSERAAKTGAEGVRLKEGSHINKSLMTLGTVIKKLSEGAESQGGHVPYRDSKLTRILQPALGGNSNTAIICNITLAQVHADETKSSLLFASRALRVTNCARVNEVLTDAALLKRQKKEIEELRAKLQGSHSEHLEEEILNLRNTLLQTELERERIALELEEEKKAQAERDRRLQEQAKKIENLSSMVLYSNRDEKRDNLKKEKRRDTWCPGNLSRENLRETSSIELKSSAAKALRPKRDMGPLLPFEELVDEVGLGMDDPLKSDNGCRNSTVNVPNRKALLHVTSRKKAPSKSKCILGESFKCNDLQAEYEDLLMEFLSQSVASSIQIDCLTRKLAEVDLGSYLEGKNNAIGLRESKALSVIKQLHDQIMILEMEKSSNQQNLDNVADLATERNISARWKFEELHEELLIAQEEAKIAHERLDHADFKLTSNEADEIKLAMEVQDLYTEVRDMINVVDQTLTLEDELFQSLCCMPKTFYDLKALLADTASQQREIIESQQKLLTHMKQRVSEFEEQIQDLKNDAENSKRTFSKLKEQHESEKTELLMQIDNLQKEISHLSSSMLAKEMVHLRKDLEKTKLKLKETESKLKNAVQEKTKLEGEKATVDRELKILHNQKALLERDINKRESIAGRRRESMAIDPKRRKGQVALFDQTMQEEYKKLEVLAFEMETTIASLEEELAAACKEKDELCYKNEKFSSELEAQSEKMSTLYSDISILQEEVSDLSIKLEESKSYQQKLEESMSKLAEEKEELAIQLTNSLLEMEEEKVVWSTKEKASIKAIEEKGMLYDLEIKTLSEELLEVRKELESFGEQCKILDEKLHHSEDDAQKEKKHSLEMASRVEQLNKDMQLADVENRRYQEKLKSNFESLSLEYEKRSSEADMLLKELSYLKKEREDLSVQLKALENQIQPQDDYQDKLKAQLGEKQKNMVELECVQRSTSEKLLEAEARADKLTQKIDDLELKLHNEEVSNSKEKARLRMRLHGTQAKLEAFRSRYSEVLNEQKLMDRKYEEASGKLKGLLAQYGAEILNLKKQLAAANANQQRE